MSVDGNKLINNGYLRTPHISSNNSNNNSNNTMNTTDNRSTVDNGNSRLIVVDEDGNNATSPLLGSINAAGVGVGAGAGGESVNSGEGKHNKLPTVVYLCQDGSGGGGGGLGGGGGIGVVGGGGIGDGSATRTRTCLECNAPSQTSDWLLRRHRLQRRHLVILAIALTVLGTAIGALAIYFAGSYRCHQLAMDGSDYIDGEYNKNVCLSEECVKTAATLLSAMDTTVDPCVNFFQYACGTWNKKHIIPEDRGSISPFEVLADEQQVILKAVLEAPVDDSDNEATIKAKMFYKSCMDIDKIRQTGEGFLKDVLKSLGGWPVIERNWQPPRLSVEELMGILRANYSESVLMELLVGADDKNSSLNIIQIDQLSMTLPARDYYLKGRNENDIKAFHTLITQTAILLGANPATAAAELREVVEFEIKLVNVSLPESDRHDTTATYNKLSLPALQALVPELNWTVYLQTVLGPQIPLMATEPIVSHATSYIIEMGKIVKAADRRVLQNYMLWRLVWTITSHMIDGYERERVEFRKILTGVQAERMRWAQCVEWTNKKLGMAVGALFIRDNFDQDSKDTALEMIHNIREAFNELLSVNDWMDDETRAVAKEKADTMLERIGYPDMLTKPEELRKEYENLTIIPDRFLENLFNYLYFESQRNIQLLRYPVDKEKWNSEPAVVNAFYNPNKNEIVIPAGMFQPHFYSQKFPKSLNYGGIGVVIGHEITHGFDDKGRQYDKDGNVMEWWNNATVEAFRNRTQCIIDQYSKYKIDEVGLYINGRMTQGENIADNGGLKQSFRAYKKWVDRHGAEPPLPGLHLTHHQLFFLNYAQIWCGSMRPEDALSKIRSSVHSPGIARILGPLSNSKDFSEAYRCRLGSPMNPEKKCSVW